MKPLYFVLGALIVFVTFLFSKNILLLKTSNRDALSDLWHLTN